MCMLMILISGIQFELEFSHFRFNIDGFNMLIDLVQPFVCLWILDLILNSDLTPFRFYHRRHPYKIYFVDNIKIQK
jgi:hypothetical protein